MNKKLPKIFHNDISKSLNNNENVYYSANSKNDNNNSNNNNNNDDDNTFFNNERKNMTIKKGIKQKINEIFASSSYVYKANVVIKTKDTTINRRIIGRNNKYLITMDNEKIPIESIVDINIKK